MEKNLLYWLHVALRVLEIVLSELGNAVPDPTKGPRQVSATEAGPPPPATKGAVLSHFFSE